MKIYFAAPLFSVAETTFNKNLYNELLLLNENIDIYLPQEFSDNTNVSDAISFGDIFCDCIDYINKSDIILAILDGSDVDSGTAVEIGYAYAKNKIIIGVRTDFRKLEQENVNLMIRNSCSSYIYSKTKSIKELAKKINDIIGFYEKNIF